MKRILFLSFLLAVVATGVQAQTFTQKCSSGQELKYQIKADQKTVALVGIVGEDIPEELVIPEKVTYSGRTYSVTAIGKRAFVECYGIGIVTIPNSIAFIDENAFGDGGETSVYDVRISEDHPKYQVLSEKYENSNSEIWTTKLIDKRTQKTLWFTVEELLDVDPEIEVEIEMEDEEEESIIRIPEVRAEFIGGIPALKKYLSENVHYPQMVEGQYVVLLEFVVEKDGSISNITVLRGGCREVNAEAIRVVKAMPKWKPGENNGQPCRSYFQLPITFTLY